VTLHREVLKLQRRAVLDFLFELGGEINDEALITNLRAMGHRIDRATFSKDIIGVLRQHHFIANRDVDPYTVVHITPAGRDIADGQATHPDISQFKTGV
jgi:Fe2+ or Zn2+ uptake regulation protein